MLRRNCYGMMTMPLNATIRPKEVLDDWYEQEQHVPGRREVNK